MKSAKFMTLSTFLGIFASAVAQAQVCQVQLNRENPRQFDVQFPDGRLVSVVGHRHTSRGEVESNALTFLSATEAEAQEIIRDLPPGSAPMVLGLLISDQGKALQHYRGDQKILQGYLAAKKYQNVNVEMREKTLNRLTTAAQMVTLNNSLGLRSLNVPSNDVDDLRMVAFGPAIELFSRQPNLFKGVRLTSAEASEEDVKQAQNLVCGGDEESKESRMFFFFLSLQARTPETQRDAVARDVSRGRNVVMNRMIDVSPLEARKLHTPDSLLALFEEALKPTKLLEGDRDLVKQHFADDIENFSTFRGCSARDLLMARNLAWQNGNSIVFLGALHSAPLAHYLVQECRSQINSPRRETRTR